MLMWRPLWKGVMVVILREAFPEWKTNAGIFDLFEDVPWSSEVTSNVLNLEYFGNHSGAKKISNLVSVFIESGVLSDDSRKIIASVIQAKYHYNWSRLWLTNSVDYNPVHNYDTEETITRERTNDVTDDATSTRTPNLNEVTTHGKTTDETDYRFGFNSSASDMNPSDKMHSEDGGTTSVSETGSDANIKHGEKGEKENEVTKISRAGNIGVTTSQKMVNEERQLWLWNYFDQIFSDIDKVLSLPFYDPCKVN